jgi:hypothetical protein
MKIHKKYYYIIFNILISIVMSAVMSLFFLIINVGLIPGFIVLWLKAFGTGFLIALPVTFLIIPLIRRLLDKITY